MNSHPIKLSRGQTRTTEASPQRPHNDMTPRKTRPVKWWAAVGVAWLAVMVYQWTMWLVEGHAKPTPTGADDVPTWLKVLCNTWQIGISISSLFLIYWYVVRPWRRERQLTFDGMLLIAWVTSWAIQDCWVNYTGQIFTYNSYLINFGCPQCHAPGWANEGGKNLAEPIIAITGIYVTFLFTGVILCNYIMRKSKQRWPQLGTLGLIGVALGFMWIADLILEPIWMMLGLDTWAGGIDSVSMFNEHYFKYPVYEGVCWGTLWAAVSCVRYFKNDKGETLAERGSSTLKTSTKNLNLLKLLAVIGILNTLYFGIYNLPFQWFATHASTPNQDLLSRSYLLSGTCGPGTTYACPGPEIPLPVGGSARVTPEGTFIAPNRIAIQANVPQ